MALLRITKNKRKGTPVMAEDVAGTEAVSKDRILLSAARLVINCHYLASDLLELARRSPVDTPAAVTATADDLRRWAHQLSNMIASIEGVRLQDYSVSPLSAPAAPAPLPPPSVPAS